MGPEQEDVLYTTLLKKVSDLIFFSQKPGGFQ